MEKLNLIQVGLGSHGKGVGKNAIISSEDFKYVGLVDVYQKGLEEAGQLFDVEKSALFTDYQEAFTGIDADAVFVSSASPAHYEICKKALESNLHVIVEKPFVLNIDEAKELVKLAEDRNLKLMIDQNYRYNLNLLEVSKVVQEKVLGEIEFVNAQFYYYHNGKQYQKDMEDYMLMEMAIHHIDLVRHLFGDVKTVNGKAWNEADSGYKGDPNVHAVFEMESGIPIFYTGSLISKGFSTPWEGNWRIQCKNGSIHLDDLGQGYGVYLVDEEKQIQKIDVELKHYEDLRSIFKEFAGAIREDREPKISGRDNLQTLATLVAIAVSSKEGRSTSPQEILV